MTFPPLRRRFRLRGRSCHVVWTLGNSSAQQKTRWKIRWGQLKRIGLLRCSSCFCRKFLQRNRSFELFLCVLYRYERLIFTTSPGKSRPPGHYTLTNPLSFTCFFLCTWIQSEKGTARGYAMAGRLIASALSIARMRNVVKLGKRNSTANWVCVWYIYIYMTYISVTASLSYIIYQPLSATIWGYFRY